MIGRGSAALLAALVLACAGCGADDDARQVVQATADTLADVRSGVLELRIALAPEDSPDEPVGFEIRGPFALPERGGLPTAELEVTQLVGTERLSSTLTLTDGRAFVTADGTTRELEAAQRDRLTVKPAGGRGLLGLDPASWLKDPELTGEDGVDEVRGELDLARAVGDVMRATGGPPLSDRVRSQITGAVTSSQAVMRTGADDRILRELDARATLDVPEDLREQLGGISGAVRMTARIALERANRPIGDIRPPD